MLDTYHTWALRPLGEWEVKTLRVLITRVGTQISCADEHDAQAWLCAEGYTLNTKPRGDMLARRLNKGPISFTDSLGRAVKVEQEQE